MNKTNESLKEIWESEEKLYRETKHLNTREYVKYLDEIVKKHILKKNKKIKQTGKGE